MKKDSCSSDVFFVLRGPFLLRGDFECVTEIGRVHLEGNTERINRVNGVSLGCQETRFPSLIVACA